MRLAFPGALEDQDDEVYISTRVMRMRSTMKTAARMGRKTG